MDVRELEIGDKIYDLGPKTVEHYSKLIAGAGTVFISGPAGFFEKENFSYGKRITHCSCKFHGNHNSKWRSSNICIKKIRIGRTNRPHQYSRGSTCSVSYG